MKRPAKLLTPLPVSFAWAWVASFGLTGAACSDAGQSPAHRLWTMADLQLSSHEGTACVNPAGLPCTYFVDRGAAQTDVLQFKLAFAEEQPMAYMTTDFWLNYDQVWVQPMYILVDAWNEKAPSANRLPGASGAPSGPIFSIGPGSSFYSPYWKVFYVEVPPGTSPTKYTSARQLFDDHLVMHDGPNRFASIGPADLFLPSADDITSLFPNIAAYLVDGAPALAGVVASAQQLSGWLDGAAVRYVDFGTDNFDADAARVVQDIPLFLFEKLDESGVAQPAGASNVGGVAPLFSGGAPRLNPVNGRPQFGAFWRLHIVTLPASAQVFMRTDQDALVAQGAAVNDVADKVLRVALDGACFATPTSFAGCVWLDSQAKIENNLGEKAIARTTLEPACPFVMFNGRPVPPQ